MKKLNDELRKLSKEIPQSKSRKQWKNLLKQFEKRTHIPIYEKFIYYFK